MTKSSRELLADLEQVLKEPSAEIKDFGKSAQQQLQDTMNNLALVTGGLAAGALVLLGTNTPVNQPLVLIGVCVLFVELVIIFGYLMHTHTFALDEVDQITDEILGPINKLLRLGHDVNLSDDVLGTEIGTRLTPVWTWLETRRDRKEQHKRKTHYAELACLGLLIFSIGMIGAGLLVPHTCAVWSIMC